MAKASTASEPGRIGTNRSALDASVVNDGSMTTTLHPASMASAKKCQDCICASVKFVPHAMTVRALRKSVISL